MYHTWGTRRRTTGRRYRMYGTREIQKTREIKIFTSPPSFCILFHFIFHWLAEERKKRAVGRHHQGRVHHKKKKTGYSGNLLTTKGSPEMTDM